MVKNKHKVPPGMWKDLSGAGKYIFNEVFDLFSDQKYVSHPLAALIPAEHWETIQWNAAWAAADIASGSDADTLKHAELI